MGETMEEGASPVLVRFPDQAICTRTPTIQLAAQPERGANVSQHNNPGEKIN